MCKTYGTCYANAKASYLAFTNATRGRVAQRKLQWRMLKRLQCLTSSFDAKTGVNKAKLDACAKTVYGEQYTKHLNIAIPKIPGMVKCRSGLPVGISAVT